MLERDVVNLELRVDFNCVQHLFQAILKAPAKPTVVAEWVRACIKFKQTFNRGPGLNPAQGMFVWYRIFITNGPAIFTADGISRDQKLAGAEPLIEEGIPPHLEARDGRLDGPKKVPAIAIARCISMCTYILVQKSILQKRASRQIHRSPRKHSCNIDCESVHLRLNW